MNNNLKVALVALGKESKIRQGHPWLFAQDFRAGYKEISVGEIFQLKTDKKELLGFALMTSSPQGTGLIAKMISNFKVTSKEAGPYKDDHSKSWFLSSLEQAIRLRENLGMREQSCRLVFSEADGLPGFILDQYILESGLKVWSLQLTNLGLEEWAVSCVLANENVSSWNSKESRDRSWAWILLLSRHLDFFQVHQVILRPFSGKNQNALCFKRNHLHKKEAGKNRVKASPVEVTVQSSTQGSRFQSATESQGFEDLKKEWKLFSEVEASSDSEVVKVDFLEFPGFLKCSLIAGQKTGLFLDQRENVVSLCRNISKNWKEVNVLDLCCYVGQWSVGIASCFQGSAPLQITAVDASESVLSYASENISRALSLRSEFTLQKARSRTNQGSEDSKIQVPSPKSYQNCVTTVQLDVMMDWPAEWSRQFEVVVCDPPAFVKERKSLESGLRGYTKLFKKALSALRPGGILVACSCSGLVSESDLFNCLQMALLETGRTGKVLERLRQCRDHVVPVHFKEAEYLKGFVISVDELLVNEVLVSLVN